ncbi:uncharacterized protein LOC129908931 [Episyrphus balteatus]|uniref:uncharacterized protein LOC129908931 n=1 Tax=Episyrphus balteatus TaxID=286459 RepID=UPI0024856428|nr:uncharacterized protein LOC129908931 [Episyrphus balteatus]XP_055841746.1 uncharacterized protein LOC129908931 [Episyrphus balteatus]XP_055841747.1 uncharacterized protein LOC129908931 [Episyrphus balteatus]
MMWGEHINRRHWEYQKTTNDDNYCYLNTNRHCVKENNSYVQNLPPYNDHLAVDILEVDSKKHDYINVQNDYKTENTILDHISGMNSTSLAVNSKQVSTSPCNSNLYVSPPYFTVDKFVNMDQTNHHHPHPHPHHHHPRDNTNRQQIIQPNRNHINNQKEISNISLEYKIPDNRESFLINNKNLIGIKVIENSHIPLMHFETTSDRPVRLNVPKQQYEPEPIITEICTSNYENDLVPYHGSDTFPPKRKKSYSNIDYMQDPNVKNDYIRNHHQLLSIHQYSGESIIKVESKNVYRVADLSATIESSQHRIGPNDFPYMEFQRNSLPKGACIQKSCITSSAKNMVREKRKPNYRELINNAHALRSSISENDLNMQIIKRTLNYKPLPTYNNYPSSRNIAIQPVKRSPSNDSFCPKIEKVDVYEKTSHENHLFIQQQQQQHHQDVCSSSKKPITSSPLDLSLKSVKIEAPPPPFDDKKKVYKGCLPKFNFEPNFVEKHNFMSNNVSSSRMQSNQSSVIRFNYNSSTASSSRPTAIDCKVEQNLFLEAPKTEVKPNVATGFDQDINRKRIFPADSFDESKYLIKKKCMESSFCGVPGLDVGSRNFDNDLKLEKKIDVNKIVQEIATTTTMMSESEIAERFDQTNIKPEPELEIELKPEPLPEEPELKAELEMELVSIPEPDSESEPEELIELKQDVSSSFASRIRTKAELKGFVFQDESADVHVQAKNNLELKTQLDLCDWNNTCEMFVDQLDRCFENISFKKSSSSSSNLLKRSMPNIQIDSENESSTSSNPSPKRSMKNVKTEITKLPINDVLPVESNVQCDDEKLKENTDQVDSTTESVNTGPIDSITDSVNGDLLNDENQSETTEIVDSVIDSLNTERSDSVNESVSTEQTDSVNGSVRTEQTDSGNDSVNTELTNSGNDSVNTDQTDSVNDSGNSEPLTGTVTESENSEPLTETLTESENVNDSVNVLPTRSNSSEERCKLSSEEDVSKDVSKESEGDTKAEISSDISSIIDKKRPINKATRIFDLTKVSVVRLKREKYVSRILKQSDAPMEQEKIVPKTQRTENISNKDTNSTPSPVATSKTTQNVLRNTDTPHKFAHRGRPLKGSKVTNKNVPSLSTIKTRLRTQALQGKKDAVFKNKKTKRRYENKSESDLPSNTDKIFLEVYRYKRALKVPPNLITIKNKCIQKISKSIADSDLEPEPATRNTGESMNCKNESNKDNVPKSIIDVLHSRVIKAKNHNHQVHNKFTQKYSKTERPHVSKSKFDIISSKSNTDHEMILNENNNICVQQQEQPQHQEKRNVFETKVIPSRTRREHKMHLNKETIREVFRGDERPSSAPPHINILEDIYDKSYNDQCIKYFQKLSLIAAESDLLQNGQQENANKLSNSSSSNILIKETNDEKKATTGKDDNNQCNNNNQNQSNMIKRKRKRRIYKRRISSGFDYLRKKKRSTNAACALRNYSRFKKRKTSTDECSPFRNESDILKEIQKWVLNKGVGQSALHKAATLGYIDVIVYCLEKMGLHPDHKDNAGYTPLHDACVNGSLDIARVLLQYGANHSESAHSGIRPIHEASENGHIEIVRMLLSYGADPLLETYAGQTPLMLASDTKMSNLISMHLSDVEASEVNRSNWSFQGPWNTNDESENGCDVFSDISSLNNLEGGLHKKLNFRRDFRYFQNNEWKTDENELISICNQNPSIKNIFCDFEILYDAANAEGELFEFEEAASPLPPLYLLKDEGMEKWVLLSDLCSLLKVKSKDTLLHKIFPSVSPSHVSRAFLKELKMCEFLERATCLQLLCAGEKINICHSKVVLIRYNENVRNLLGVKTIIMKL